MNEELTRDLNRMMNDRSVAHKHRTLIQSALYYLSNLEEQLENSYTFDQFVSAARSDNKKNIGKGRKFVQWMEDIKEELNNG
jgi:hypothetical protein